MLSMSTPAPNRRDSPLSPQDQRRFRDSISSLHHATLMHSAGHRAAHALTMRRCRRTNKSRGKPFSPFPAPGRAPGRAPGCLLVAAALRPEAAPRRSRLLSDAGRRPASAQGATRRDPGAIGCPCRALSWSDPKGSACCRRRAVGFGSGRGRKIERPKGGKEKSAVSQFDPTSDGSLARRSLARPDPLSRIPTEGPNLQPDPSRRLVLSLFLTSSLPPSSLPTPLRLPFVLRTVKYTDSPPPGDGRRVRPQAPDALCAQS